MSEDRFGEAARALGASDARIMFRHLLPNAMVATLTFLPFILNGSITTLTSLDFLGFGRVLSHHRGTDGTRGKLGALLVGHYDTTPTDAKERGTRFHGVQIGNRTTAWYSSWFIPEMSARVEAARRTGAAASAPPLGGSRRVQIQNAMARPGSPTAKNATPTSKR